MRTTPPQYVPGMQTHLGPNAKKVLLSVAHGGSAPEVGDADAALWLKGYSTESRLLRWVACSDFVDLHRQFIEEGIILASTTSHCSLHFDGFMVHRNVQSECTTTDFVHQLDNGAWKGPLGSGYLSL